MNSSPIAHGMAEGGLTNLLLTTAVNSFLLLVPICLVLLLLGRRGSGATRHFAWLAALASLLLLPVAANISLPVKRPLWAGQDNPVTNWVIFLTYSAATNEAAGVPGYLAKPSSLPPHAPPPAADANSPANPAGWAPLPASWSALWLAVCLGILAVQGWQRLRRWQFGRLAMPAAHPHLLALLAEELQAIGCHRAVRLLLAPGRVMPMTWGARQPVIILPEAAVNWETAHLRLVLRHELLHVRRWDSLAQTFAGCVCALFWFNPLAWLAARRMRVERERACDEAVLRKGVRPSAYASCLVEIARRFSALPAPAAVGIARPSQLESRVRAVLSPARLPRPLGMAQAALILAVVFGATLFFFGPQAGALDANPGKSKLANVRKFVEAKQKQARELAEKLGQELDPEMQKFFAAGTQGDWQQFTNRYNGLLERRQNHRANPQADREIAMLHGPQWAPAMECAGFYEQARHLDPKHLQLFGGEIISSIPTGSVYFGGTDAGRFIVTAMSRDHAQGDPFFTLSQNPLADNTYMEYLRQMYGNRLKIPTSEDMQRCFTEYLADAQERLQKKQLKPGEDVRVDGGRVQVSGQVAVMAINARLARVIFDQNPQREFFVEESFPLDWMYPRLEPQGLIFKVNREPLAELTPAMLQRDREYWQKQCNALIGPWLRPGVSVEKLAEFAGTVHGDQNLKGFQGDPAFPANEAACKTFAKLRGAIAGLYDWRQKQKLDQRLAAEAEYAYQQAFALCPYSPEAVYRYVNLLVAKGKSADALVVADAAHRLATKRKAPEAAQFEELARQLRKTREAAPR